MTKRWIVTMSGERPIREVRKDLAKHGFDVADVYDEIGSISGAGDDDVAEKLREVPGVADVSPEEPIDIGPPDSPVTW